MDIIRRIIGIFKRGSCSNCKVHPSLRTPVRCKRCKRNGYIHRYYK